MGEYKFVDENKEYEIDISSAIWATDSLNNIYNKAIKSTLSDVDFIAETEEEILFIEYKNCDIKNAVNPGAFIDKIKKDTHYNKIAQKYYGSLLYILGCRKFKVYKYIYILECGMADSVLRKLIRNKIRTKLPFELKETDSNIEIDMISDFEILSIDEWNNHESYSKFPIKPIE